jgi:hypothetical protein
MQTTEWIAAREFCKYHHIELSFIYSLQEYGLLELERFEEEICIPAIELKHVEQMSRMHHEMDINLEGIETINHLLQRMEEMQQKILILSNRLNLYENS